MQEGRGLPLPPWPCIKGYEFHLAPDQWLRPIILARPCQALDRPTWSYFDSSSRMEITYMPSCLHVFTEIIDASSETNEIIP